MADFERDEADAYLWRAGLLSVKEKRMLWSIDETASQS